MQRQVPLRLWTCEIKQVMCFQNYSRGSGVGWTFLPGWGWGPKAGGGLARPPGLAWGLFPGSVPGLPLEPRRRQAIIAPWLMYSSDSSADAANFTCSLWRGGTSARAAQGLQAPPGGSWGARQVWAAEPGWKAALAACTEVLQVPNPPWKGLEVTLRYLWGRSSPVLHTSSPASSWDGWSTLTSVSDNGLAWVFHHNNTDRLRIFQIFKFCFLVDECL